jgi:hypothetical protein
MLKESLRPSLEKVKHIQDISWVIGFEVGERRCLTSPGKSNHFNSIVVEEWLPGILAKDRDIDPLLNQFFCKIPNKDPGK